RLLEGFEVPGGERRVNEERDILHLFPDLFQHALHDLAEHEEVHGDQLFVEPLNIAANVQPAWIFSANVLGVAVVNAGNHPDIVQLTQGCDFNPQNAALGYIFLQNDGAAAIRNHGDRVIVVVELGGLVASNQQGGVVAIVGRHQRAGDL